MKRSLCQEIDIECLTEYPDHLECTLSEMRRQVVSAFPIEYMAIAFSWKWHIGHSRLPSYKNGVPSATDILNEYRVEANRIRGRHELAEIVVIELSAIGAESTTPDFRSLGRSLFPDTDRRSDRIFIPRNAELAFAQCESSTGNDRTPPSPTTRITIQACRFENQQGNESDDHLRQSIMDRFRGQAINQFTINEIERMWGGRATVDLDGTVILGDRATRQPDRLYRESVIRSGCREAPFVYSSNSENLWAAALDGVRAELDDRVRRLFGLPPADIMGTTVQWQPNPAQENRDRLNTCAFASGDHHLKCAVNPMEECRSCSHWEEKC